MGYHFPNILTDPTIQGTVKAGTGLTMPAFAAGGDISMGANKLKTTNLLFKERDAETFRIRDAGDTSDKGLFLGNLYPTGIIAFEANGQSFQSFNVDAGFTMIKSRGSGVGPLETARLQGAADPEFQIGNNGNALRGSNAGYLAFYGTAPIAKQTGVAVTAAAIHAALVNLGLIAA